MKALFADLDSIAKSVETGRARATMLAVGLDDADGLIADALTALREEQSLQPMRERFERVLSAIRAIRSVA